MTKMKKHINDYDKNKLKD